MPVSVRIQKEWYERDRVAADACAVYLFGENYAQQGTDYVPSGTQAVIRGLPNAIGIPTKNDMFTDKNYSYLTDRTPFIHSCCYVKSQWFIKFGPLSIFPISRVKSG